MTFLGAFLSQFHPLQLGAKETLKRRFLQICKISCASQTLRRTGAFWILREALYYKMRFLPLLFTIQLPPSRSPELLESPKRQCPHLWQCWKWLWQHQKVVWQEKNGVWLRQLPLWSLKIAVLKLLKRVKVQYCTFFLSIASSGGNFSPGLGMRQAKCARLMR